MTIEAKCASCGLKGHRYGRNEGMERYDPMACINSLRGELEAHQHCGPVTDEQVIAAARAVARSLNLTYWSGTEEQARLLCIDAARAALEAAAQVRSLIPNDRIH